jgi:hypothetical protein
LNREVCEIKRYVPLSTRAIIIKPARCRSCLSITGTRKRLLHRVRPSLLSRNRGLLPTNNLVPPSMLARADRSMKIGVKTACESLLRYCKAITGQVLPYRAITMEGRETIPTLRRKRSTWQRSYIHSVSFAMPNRVYTRIV